MGASTGITATGIFMLAESKYCNMMLDNKWTRVLTTGEATFHAGMNKGNFEPECINCQGFHHAKECKKPRDQIRINDNMAKFCKMLKKKHGESKPQGKLLQ
jgi:hypothetical protein